VASDAVSGTDALPGIAAYRAGNTGIPYVWSFAAAAPGPHAMIVALTHGNEPCGAVALSRLFEAGVRPARGRLTIAFANPEAYGAVRAVCTPPPPPPRCLDRDLNRLWRDDWIDADTESREAARARALRPLVATADALLDLHSTASVPRPFLVLADLDKTRALADRMGWPRVQQIMPGGCAEGRHLIDYGRFSDAADPAAAVTVECGRHLDADSGEVAFAASLRFLESESMIAPAAARSLAAAYPGAAITKPEGAIARYRTVAPCVVRSDRFELRVPADGFAAVVAGEVVARDGDADVIAPFDATIIAPRPAPAPGETAFLWSVRIG
jgi:predicted deacylase